MWWLRNRNAWVHLLCKSGLSCWITRVDGRPIRFQLEGSAGGPNKRHAAASDVPAGTVECSPLRHCSPFPSAGPDSTSRSTAKLQRTAGPVGEAVARAVSKGVPKLHYHPSICECLLSLMLRTSYLGCHLTSCWYGSRLYVVSYVLYTHINMYTCYVSSYALLWPS